MPINRTLPIKDSAEGWEEPFNRNADAIDARGIYLQNDTSNAANVLISRDVSDNLTLQDAANASGVTLSRLVTPQSNLTAVIDPTAANDNTQGYAAGSLWVNTVNTSSWVCISSATGAAVWVVAGATPREVNAAGDITTGSVTDVLVTSMTLTPGAGTWMVLFSSDWSNGTNGASMFASCYANGVQVTNSQRTYTRGNQAQRSSVVVSCLATVAAGQAVDIRWRVSAGTGTMGNRSLMAIKVA